MKRTLVTLVLASFSLVSGNVQAEAVFEFIAADLRDLSGPRNEFAGKSLAEMVLPDGGGPFRAPDILSFDFTDEGDAIFGPDTKDLVFTDSSGEFVADEFGLRTGGGRGSASVAISRHQIRELRLTFDDNDGSLDSLYFYAPTVDLPLLVPGNWTRVVPEPSSSLLLISSIIGLLAVRRHPKRAS